MTTPHDEHPYALGSTIRNAHEVIAQRIWALNLETREQGADPAAVLTAADAFAQTIMEAIEDSGYTVVRASEEDQ